MKDDPIAACPECSGAVKRLLYPVGVVFKGSGWYINDSRKPEPGADSGGAKSEDTGSEAKPEDTKSAETKPAESKPAESKAETASATE